MHANVHGKLHVHMCTGGKYTLDCARINFTCARMEREKVIRAYVHEKYKYTRNPARSFTYTRGGKASGVSIPGRGALVAAVAKLVLQEPRGNGRSLDESPVFILADQI